MCIDYRDSEGWSRHKRGLWVSVGDHFFQDRGVDTVSLGCIKLNLSNRNRSEHAGGSFRQMFPRILKLTFRDCWQFIDLVALRVIIKVLIERAIEKIQLPVVARDEDTRNIMKIAITNCWPTHNKPPILNSRCLLDLLDAVYDCFQFVVNVTP
jgi:hypothetical protein